jgi:hypothetical protein
MPCRQMITVMKNYRKHVTTVFEMRKLYVANREYEWTNWKWCKMKRSLRIFVEGLRKYMNNTSIMNVPFRASKHGAQNSPYKLTQNTSHATVEQLSPWSGVRLVVI